MLPVEVGTFPGCEHCEQACCQYIQGLHDFTMGGLWGESYVFLKQISEALVQKVPGVNLLVARRHIHRPTQTLHGPVSIGTKLSSY